MDWSSYLLGLLTLPVLVVVATACSALRVFASPRLATAIHRRFGVRFSYEVNGRYSKGPDDALLRRDIWWNRTWGPVFVGGWYFEQPRLLRERTFAPGTNARIHRWIGFGKAEGRAVTFYFKRDLVQADPDVESWEVQYPSLSAVSA